uniref:Large ribosomal subunit protein mL49 n=1 Tax=Phallusia mammillata TaxID=59560 RepID=A0A6F9DM37_9ASCI|nr:39S ribosomal protein L49, mitochondrial-like [Phallusia mammillata]
MALRKCIYWNKVCPTCRVLLVSLNGPQITIHGKVKNARSGLQSYSTQANENNPSCETGYTVSKEDFKWVKRLLPPSKIPDPPKHAEYPTPSGWSPPLDPPPDLPYFVRRNKYHEFSVTVETKVGGGAFTHITKIEGDIWALNKDLARFLEPELKYDLATTVHEVNQRITVKGKFQDQVVKFLLLQGF